MKPSLYTIWSKQPYQTKLSTNKHFKNIVHDRDQRCRTDKNVKITVYRYEYLGYDQNDFRKQKSTVSDKWSKQTHRH